MEKKNTMLLTVIAVATLLVAVVGATFAYYSVQGAHDYKNTVVTTTTGKVGTVTYTGTENTLHLDVTSAQMAENIAPQTYYSTTTAGQAATSSTDHTIGTFALTGANSGDKYTCTFTFNISVSNSTANISALTNDDSTIHVTVPGTISGVSSTYYTKAVSTTAVADSATVTLTADSNGTANATITAYQDFVNRNANQNTLSELGLTTTINVSDVSCNTAS